MKHIYEQQYEYGIGMRGDDPEDEEFEPHRWGMTKSEAELWVREWEADARKEYQRGLFYVIRRPVGRWEHGTPQEK